METTSESTFTGGASEDDHDYAAKQHDDISYVGRMDRPRRTGRAQQPEADVVVPGAYSISLGPYERPSYHAAFTGGKEERRKDSEAAPSSSQRRPRRSLESKEVENANIDNSLPISEEDASTFKLIGARQQQSDIWELEDIQQVEGNKALVQWKAVRVSNKHQQRFREAWQTQIKHERVVTGSSSQDHIFTFKPTWELKKNIPLPLLVEFEQTRPRSSEDTSA